MPEDEEDVSCNAESLFTNIPIKKRLMTSFAMKFATTQKLKPICKQSIFDEVLNELTAECSYTVTGRLCKQIDSVAMGGTLSVILSECLLNKMEKGVVIQFKPKFYC